VVAVALALGAVPALAAAGPSELAAQAAERAHDDRVARIVIVLILAPLVLTFLIEQATELGWLPSPRRGLWRGLDVVVMIGSALWTVINATMFVASIVSLFRLASGGAAGTSSSDGFAGRGATTRW